MTGSCAGLLLAFAAGCGAAGDPSMTKIAADTCMTGSEKSLIVTRMRFARQDRPGVSIGFDLDGYVATSNDPKTCGHASLKSPPPSETPGIDNQLSAVLPAIDSLVPNTVDMDLQNAINDGMLLLGFHITHLDDRMNDGCVQVGFTHLTGHATAGTDHILNANQTFDVDKAWPVTTATGTIVNGYLDVGPFDITLPVKIQDWNFPLTAHGARIHLAITNDEAMEGVLGGSVDVEELIAKVLMYGIEEKVKMALPGLVRNIADLDQDPATMKCRQFSMAATISARNAFINP